MHHHGHDAEREPTVTDWMGGREGWRKKKGKNDSGETEGRKGKRKEGRTHITCVPPQQWGNQT